MLWKYVLQFISLFALLHFSILFDFCYVLHWTLSIWAHILYEDLNDLELNWPVFIEFRLTDCEDFQLRVCDWRNYSLIGFSSFKDLLRITRLLWFLLVKFLFSSEQQFRIFSILVRNCFTWLSEVFYLLLVSKHY